MNIRLRLTLWYTVILTIILLIFSGVVYIGVSRSLLSILDTQLVREAGQLTGQAQQEDEEFETEYYIPEEGIYWRVLSMQGQPVIDQGDFNGGTLPPLNTTTATFGFGTLADGTPIRLYTLPFQAAQGQGIVQVAESYTNIQTIEQLLLLFLTLGGFITVMLAGGGGWFLAGRALTPIDRITRMAQAISVNDLHQRLNLDMPNDEVGRLANTFDQMLTRLEDAFLRQKQFIADASHEMRTPLTILKGDVEVTLNRPRTAERYRETLEMVNETTDQLTALVEELLLLARADNNQYLLNLDRFDLCELLAQQITHLTPYANRSQITLHFTPPEAIMLNADSAKLTRLFLNIIGNAIKYSQPNDQVNVKATIENNQAKITIVDNGPGISAEHLPHLFERFYRADKARSRQKVQNDSGTGAGLGLSIAHWIAQAHRGRINVTSKVEVGTTFTVWLPLG